MLSELDASFIDNPLTCMITNNTSNPNTVSPSSPAQPPLVNNEIHNFSKRPRSPVTAYLDTVNILPLEHRRKRIKLARVRK